MQRDFALSTSQNRAIVHFSDFIRPTKNLYAAGYARRWQS